MEHNINVYRSHCGLYLAIGWQTSPQDMWGPFLVITEWEWFNSYSNNSEKPAVLFPSKYADTPCRELWGGMLIYFVDSKLIRSVYSM